MARDKHRPAYAGRLDDEQRRRVRDCLCNDGLSVPSDRFETLICDIETSIADFLSIATEESFREDHDALRQLYKLAHDPDPQIGVIRAHIEALPRRAAEYVNRRWPIVSSRLLPIEPQESRFQDWARTAVREYLVLVVQAISAEGAQVVEGRSRGDGKRSARKAEPIIMGEARGAGSMTRLGGRPKSDEEHGLVIYLAADWLHATGQKPTPGRSDKGGFGDLVHSVFQWLGCPEGSAAYALRQYWAEVPNRQNRAGSV